MRVKFLGSGDAFGSGGRFNTCILIERSAASILVDCGASAMIAIRKFGVDPNSVATILLSHLHADHFGGLPFFILDGQLVSRRTRPLTIVGPQGLRGRLETLMEAHFPGSSKVERKFSIDLIELVPEVRMPAGTDDLNVTAFPVSHSSGTPSLALRLECDGNVLAYTGDTEWIDTLIKAGQRADLFIAECYTFDRKVRYHLDYSTLRGKLPLIGAKQVILTHMSQDMLAHSASIEGCLAAEDGLEITLF